MIKYNKLPENIEVLLKGAVNYLQSQTDVIFAYLFGSLAKERHLPLSDVDIAVYLGEDVEIPGTKLEILGELIDVLQTDEIDLVVLNTAPLPLKMEILQNRKILVDNAPFIRHAYESLTMREYFDFSFIELSILKRRYVRG